MRVAHLPGIGIARQYGETYDDYLEILDLLDTFEEPRKGL